MKKISTLLSLALLIAGTMLAVSCSDDVAGEDPWGGNKDFEVDPAGLTFFANEIEAKEIAVSGQSDAWFAEAPDSWINIVMSLDKVTVTVNENTTGSSRSGNIVFKGENGGYTSVPVTQTGEPGDYFIVDPQLIPFGEEADSRTVSVFSTFEWTVAVESGAETWLTAEKTDEGVKVSVGENAGSERTAKIVFTLDGVDEPVEAVVTQAGAENPEFAYTGASIEYEILEEKAHFTLMLFYTEGGYLKHEFYIEGYAELADGSETFELPAGTYTVSDTNAPGTLVMGGEDSYFTVFGTSEFRDLHYEFGIPTTMFLVTGGAMTVEKSGDWYSVTASFDGELVASDTGHSASFTGQRYSYSGEISEYVE